jgi:hypothetical protein
MISLRHSTWQAGLGQGMQFLRRWFALLGVAWHGGVLCGLQERPLPRGVQTHQHRHRALQVMIRPLLCIHLPHDHNVDGCVGIVRCMLQETTGQCGVEEVERVSQSAPSQGCGCARAGAVRGLQGGLQSLGRDAGEVQEALLPQTCSVQDGAAGVDIKGMFAAVERVSAPAGARERHRQQSGQRVGAAAKLVEIKL